MATPIVRTVVDLSQIGALMRLECSVVLPAFDDDEAVFAMDLLQRNDT
jgi:hypothetical protein